jgi:hypothetical protein
LSFESLPLRWLIAYRPTLFIARLAMQPKGRTSRKT